MAHTHSSMQQLMVIKKIGVANNFERNMALAEVKHLRKCHGHPHILSLEKAYINAREYWLLCEYIDVCIE